MSRLLAHFDKTIWLNPQEENYWNYYASIHIINQLVEQQMFPLTLDGLSKGIKSLL